MSKGQTLQDPFLNALRKDRIPVSIFLVNGIKLQGQIESFDQYVVLLKNTVSQMVYKHAISTVVPIRNPRTDGSTAPVSGYQGGMGGGAVGGYQGGGYERQGGYQGGGFSNNRPAGGFTRTPQAGGFERQGYERSGYQGGMGAGFDRGMGAASGFERTGFEERGFDRQGFEERGFDGKAFEGGSTSDFNRQGFDANADAKFNADFEE